QTSPLGQVRCTWSMPRSRCDVWVFRKDKPCTLDLEASAYLERGLPEPRATRQIVLRERAKEAEVVEGAHIFGTYGWSIVKDRPGG
ncbi:MAG: heparinase II/III family protein, partial [Pseudomonadota bacterium]